MTCEKESEERKGTTNAEERRTKEDDEDEDDARHPLTSLLSDVLLVSFNGDEEDEVTWLQWKRTEKRVDLQRISGSVRSTCSQRLVSGRLLL